METTRYRILAAELDAVIKAAVVSSEDHLEICGVLIESGRRLELVMLPNMADREGSFELDMDEVEALGASVDAAGKRLIGTFHSHPVSAAVPSESDIESAFGELMLIVDTCHESARLWQIRDGVAEERHFDLVH